MAAQVLSGSGNVSYTNSTGQNVRLVINYLDVLDTCTLSIPGAGSITFGQNGSIYGKTLAYRSSATAGNGSMAAKGGSNSDHLIPIPLEIAMANGDTFSISATRAGSADIKGYNIIIIPEAG